MQYARTSTDRSEVRHWKDVLSDTIGALGFNPDEYRGPAGDRRIAARYGQTESSSTPFTWDAFEALTVPTGGEGVKPKGAAMLKVDDLPTDGAQIEEECDSFYESIDAEVADLVVILGQLDPFELLAGGEGEGTPRWTEGQSQIIMRAKELLTGWQN